MNKVHCDAMSKKLLRVKCEVPHLCKNKFHYHGNVEGMKNRETHRCSHCIKYEESGYMIVIDENTRRMRKL